jgi:hypothetical protein
MPSAQRRTNALLPSACIAVDWSGAIDAVRAHLWLAEAQASGLVRVECGRTREELVGELIERAHREPRLVVGLDFAFAFPLWYQTRLGVRDARSQWLHVARHSEEWLARCSPPFWGRPLVCRPEFAAHESEWRATESERLPIRGIGPKSIFQIGGAGSVGTSSLRGMPHLAKLQDAGFAIWPFDRPRLPMVVEIYPRYLSGAVDKSNAVARALYLEAHLSGEPRALLARAAASEDAFDAAVSAVSMQRFARDFARLSRVRRSALDRREGRIWVPLRDPAFERWLQPIPRSPRGPTRAS